MTIGDAAIVLAGAFAGGFVNGLTGFGTGLVGVGIWLQAVSPAVAASLAIGSSVVAQLQALPLLKGPIDWRGIGRFLLPGLIATPFGAAALALVEARHFKLGVGLFLVLYSIAALARVLSVSTRVQGYMPDGVVGFVSGFLGGATGLSGALMALWTDIRRDGKDARRALMQIFNLGILGLALVVHLAAGLVGPESVTALAVALPGTIAGAWIGGRAYRRLGDGDFRLVILVLLLASGLGLVGSGLLGG